MPEPLRPLAQVRHQFTSPEPVEEVYRHIFLNVSPFFAGWGYNLRAQPYLLAEGVALLDTPRGRM